MLCSVAESSDPFSLRLLRYVPRNLVSRLFGRVARIESPRAVPRWLIQTWITKFRVDVTEAERPPEDYRSLLEFFTRALKPGARPVDSAPDALVSPVDGALGAMGAIDGDTLFQAKGMNYSAAALLGSSEAARAFEGGSFFTVYLSPRDYHRIHSPADGTITRVLYEPGTLWPVNPPSVRRIPSLFAVNERVTLWIETAQGPLALVLVGATNVGSMRLAFTDFTTNRGKPRQALDLAAPVKKGDHVATFELGSTIVLLCPRGVALERMWENAKVRVGQKVARVTAR
jgi:phosphatidylserine decarboxylase